MRDRRGMHLLSIIVPLAPPPPNVFASSPAAAAGLPSDHSGRLGLPTFHRSCGHQTRPWREMSPSRHPDRRRGSICCTMKQCMQGTRHPSTVIGSGLCCPAPVIPHDDCASGGRKAISQIHPGIHPGSSSADRTCIQTQPSTHQVPWLARAYVFVRHAPSSAQPASLVGARPRRPVIPSPPDFASDSIFSD